MDALNLLDCGKQEIEMGMFFSGRLNTMNKILILPNTGKQKDEDPVIFYIAPLKPRRPDGSRKRKETREM